MISFEKFTIQDDVDKYNMLLECGAEINALEKRKDKAIEVLKLCNSQCAKETIEILKGEPNNE